MPKIPQVYSRPPWERMMRIHQLLQNKEYPNCSKLNAIEEAERWVLSWGSHATVVRPQALRERLEYLRRYAEDET